MGLTHRQETREFMKVLTGMTAYCAERNGFMGKPLRDAETWAAMSQKERELAVLTAFASLPEGKMAWAMDKIHTAIQEEAQA